MAAFLALDRGEAGEDLPGTDLRVCQRDREVFPARLFGLAHPAAADFGRAVSGEDAVVRLDLAGRGPPSWQMP